MENLVASQPLPVIAIQARKASADMPTEKRGFAASSISL
jgi:hypothetical protein